MQWGQHLRRRYWAALFMVRFRTLLRAVADRRYGLSFGANGGHKGQREADLESAVLLTNNYIARTHGSANMFATVYFGILNVGSGRMCYVNGGHELPLLLRAEGSCERLSTMGPALGMFPTALQGGPDGVSEARDALGRFYSEERLLHVVRGLSGSASDLLEGIAADVERYVGNAPQSDDITMLAVRRRN